jgi:hypothetical protein
MAVVHPNATPTADLVAQGVQAKRGLPFLLAERVCTPSSCGILSDESCRRRFSSSIVMHGERDVNPVLCRGTFGSWAELWL